MQKGLADARPFLNNIPMALCILKKSPPLFYNRKDTRVISIILTNLFCICYYTEEQIKIKIFNIL